MRNGVSVWGGIVWDREFDQENRKLTITAYSHEIYRFNRVLLKTRKYTDEDVFDVVRDLVNAMNYDLQDGINAIAGEPAQYNGTGGRPDSANIGLDLGTGLRGVTMTNEDDFRGIELKYIGEIINALSDNKNKYFEWRIEHTFTAGEFQKALKLTVPAANGYDSTLLFEYPGVISKYTWSDSMENASTRFWVTGAGDGPEKRIEYFINDTILSGGVLGDYDYIDYPLFDELELSRHGSVKNVDTLKEHAEQYAKESVPPMTDWEVTLYGEFDPQVSAFNQGDWAKFIIKDENFSSTQAFTRRIEEITVNVADAENQHDTVTLALTNETGPSTDMD